MSDEAKIIEVNDGWSYAGKVCRCGKCGTVARCTPEFDFYADNDGDPLECERCFRARIKARGIELGPGFKDIVDPRN